MDKGMLPLLELLLIVGVVFGFGFWQLAALKRDEQQQKRESAKQPNHPAAAPLSQADAKSSDNH
ncbi:MAG: hypothetical protein IPN92_07820 [Chromatiaceae bacterium]|nr:hypothetical protein [Chromatiaceae bacterium]